MARSTKLVFIVLLSWMPLFSCFSQDVTFNSQAEVDAFDSSITTITGSLNIETTSTTDPIIDLSNLLNLVFIEEDLEIKDNNTLTNIDGLANISSIGRNLEIYSNDLLINIDSLANVTNIGGGLSISNNYVLTDVDGLVNTPSIGGELYIRGNQALLNLDGLVNLSAISEGIDIQSNNVLLNLDGLVNISIVEGWLYIIGNASLTNIDGLENISTVGNNLVIATNGALTNLNGLGNISSVGLNLQISGNSILSNCCGIQTLLATPNAVDGLINIFSNPSGCSSEEEIIQVPCITNVEIVVNPPCIGIDNGSIQVEITGGAAPFTYTWERQEDGQTQNNGNNLSYFFIENLRAGTYTLTIMDSEGAEFIQENIILNPILGSVFEIIELTTTNSANGTSNGAIHLTVAGGTPPYDLNWSGPSTGIQSNSTGLTFTIPFLSQGEYEIMISDDVGNQQTISITLLDETVPVFPCTQPLDIVILNDVSGSVDEVEFNESKQFFVDFLNAANIGPSTNESHAAIIEWSSTAQQDIQIPMTGNLSSLQDYVNYNRSFDNATNPHAALTFGKTYLASVARPDIERVLILSTDGNSDQISPSLIALADQYKAEGYHIVTIAFDHAFASSYTRNILRQVASIDLLAPGAPAYSLLDENLAENIVTLYLCPIAPGSSASAYFNRDGAIDITDIEVNGDCPNPDNISVTFTIEALQELSIPPGAPVTFYYNNPALFGATPILTWITPCAIPAGTTETYTVTLPVTSAANIFAVLNDDNSQEPPISFPITDLNELAWSNNTSDSTVCLDPLPTLQALKYTTTPTPICNNTVIYTVDVCNITDLDATGVIITDNAPNGFVLINSVINDNGCSMDNNGLYDIPGGCCISIIYTYDATNAADGHYNDQDVQLSGDINQVFLDFDGATTAQEDVVIDGTIDCPSTVITFTKEVNVTDICEDAFVVYTFTIDNQLNVPLQGLSMTDLLPAPVTWVFQPYSQDGLSISHSTFMDGSATFVIDEVQANTIASFSIDAILGDWAADGVLNNTATLENVPDLENGGIQTLTSNTVTANVSATPEIEVNQTYNCSDNTILLSATMNGQASTAWAWVATGDGSFIDHNLASTAYILGTEDLANGETILSVTGNSTCGEINETVEVVIDAPEPIFLTLETCTGETIEYEGVILSIGDNQDFILQNSLGCDSIVSVTIVGVPALTESLTLKTCEGETIDYDGTTLSIGDSQDFTFQSSMGCDSIVSVTVMGLSSATTPLILETCEGETIDYNGTTLSIGDSQDFIFQSSTDCDSIVTVTVIEIVATNEELTLEICEGETIDYNGMTMSIGDTENFVFQSSNGCDSIIAVTVLGLPTSNEELILEACIGTPIFYNNIPLSIGENSIFEFKNTYGCDSIVSLTVISKESTGKISLPNVFSPNNDGINDCLHPFSGGNLDFKTYKFEIFNRWGGLVFSTTDPYDCWDGSFNNELADNGVYVWFIKMATDICGGSVLKGDVVLIR